MAEKIHDLSTSNSIKKLSFGILSASDIEKMSVTQIDSKVLYDVVSRRPMSNGPLDLKLGVLPKTEYVLLVTKRSKIVPVILVI